MRPPDLVCGSSTSRRVATGSGEHWLSDGGRGHAATAIEGAGDQPGDAGVDLADVATAAAWKDIASRDADEIAASRAVG
jgi:hypothetical protein